MKRTARRLLVTLLALGASAGFLWAQDQPTIQVKTTADGTRYLTDSGGMTLYYFTVDTDGQSACYGQCADHWPIFYTDTVTVPQDLSASDFGTITRKDGTKQTTYKGWPLYYWYKDKKPGDMSGEGVGKVWYIEKVPPYTVMVATKKPMGDYLVDGNGNTLYYFTKDSPGESVCTGDCLKNWPAFAVQPIVVPSALDPKDFSTITRDDGTAQVTYKGYPLYYFVRDTKRGDTTGEAVGKVWYVVSADNFNPSQARTKSPETMAAKGSN